jgi:hypothetical protein
MKTRALRVATAALVGVCWASAAIFGAYILAFYGGALRAHQLDAWNSTLPELYAPRSLAATIGIGLHFAGGGVLLLLGPLQLIAAVRTRAPRLHRWVGRIYALAALLAGLGGLGYIVARGTIGGAPMDVGFALYGALVVISAVATVRYAISCDLARHRAWALRLFALAVGSWLYRVGYGFWALATNLAGHTPEFRGWFDNVMDFAFYLPNLAVVELAIRARAASPRVQLVAAIVMIGAAILIGAATVFFTTLAWAPGIAAGLAM